MHIPFIQISYTACTTPRYHFSKCTSDLGDAFTVSHAHTHGPQEKITTAKSSARDADCRPRRRINRSTTMAAEHADSVVPLGTHTGWLSEQAWMQGAFSPCSIPHRYREPRRSAEGVSAEGTSPYTEGTLPCLPEQTCEGSADENPPSPVKDVNPPMCHKWKRGGSGGAWGVRSALGAVAAGWWRTKWAHVTAT